MTESALQVGDTAPDFTLPNEQGTLVHLADYRGKRVVLYFYPMDDTPGCTTQACNFRDVYLNIEERNAVVLGISPDDSTSHQAFKTKFQLPFTLLVDADHAAARAYGAWQDGAQYVTRSQFIIDENGRLIDVQVPVRASESAQRAIEALTSLGR
jgi:thioredoxin-dependent peroxiredoxin